MTRMMHLQRTFRVTYTANATYTGEREFQASNDEAAEDIFQEMVDNGEFERFYFEEKPYVTVEIQEVEEINTSQEQ